MEYVAEEEEEEKGDYSNSENPPHRLTCSRHDLKNFRHAVSPVTALQSTGHFQNAAQNLSDDGC
jgi:hypothetical protein